MSDEIYGTTSCPSTVISATHCPLRKKNVWSGENRGKVSETWLGQGLTVLLSRFVTIVQSPKIWFSLVLLCLQSGQGTLFAILLCCREIAHTRECGKLTVWLKNESHHHQNYRKTQGWF